MSGNCFCPSSHKLTSTCIELLIDGWIMNLFKYVSRKLSRESNKHKVHFKPCTCPYTLLWSWCLLLTCKVSAGQQGGEELGNDVILKGRKRNYDNGELTKSPHFRKGFQAKTQIKLIVLGPEITRMLS